MSQLLSETLREITPSLSDGHYSIVEAIRDGRIYLAEKAGKRFVLKKADSAKGLEMLKREYELSIGLSHPSLAYVFTWEENSPVGPCIVQEYIDGRTLDSWLAERPSAKERKRILGELLSVAAYLHRKGIVHNDLTPSNILVTRTDDSLKIIDLGFADSDAYSQKARGGTRGYASPELIAGKETDARSDIYSVGRLMKDIFPGRFRCISHRCLRENPENRYQSVQDLQKAIKNRKILPRMALCLVLAAIVALPYIIDYREEAGKKAAIKNAKDQVEEVYARAIPAFREAILEAKTVQEVNDAWMVFLEDQKQVNFNIPDAAPEAVRPAIRDYILHRNNEILPVLGEELNSRMRELSGIK